MKFEDYLAIFNSVQLVGWISVLWFACEYVVENKTVEILYDVKIRRLLEIMLGLSIVEVFHKYYRLSCNIWPNIVQNCVRILIFFGIRDLIPWSNWPIGAVLSWALIDITDYLYFLTKFYGLINWIFWLKYNAFFILIPLATLFEALCVVETIPDFWENCPKNSTFSFSFYFKSCYLIICIMPVILILKFFYIYMSSLTKRDIVYDIAD
ncbi:unnamed protein product [Blepharisma stoltei]|uniref:very-long-chain (3R)-3-hydroxyacyl-CoA dehydratase n=1 Tax=Blepharisma stoltei TaxID=1481888 RepID=A0AAU9ID66_9CILI|nr:unnamed protein product [Blepharisma stoltei]